MEINQQACETGGKNKAPCEGFAEHGVSVDKLFQARNVGGRALNINRIRQHMEMPAAHFMGLSVVVYINPALAKPRAGLYSDRLHSQTR